MSHNKIALAGLTLLLLIFVFSMIGPCVFSAVGLLGGCAATQHTNYYGQDQIAIEILGVSAILILIFFSCEVTSEHLQARSCKTDF